MADELLAQFPAKNPNPVFLISDKAELLYANLAAESMLKELDLLTEDNIHINDETFKFLTRSIKKNQAIDLTLGDKYYVNFPGFCPLK
jgi:hypothetical protein